MRIHELLEACVEYTAFEGVLGQYPFRQNRTPARAIWPGPQGLKSDSDNHVVLSKVGPLTRTGCQPNTLVHHLSTLDASIDAAYFAHIWSLLVRHPSIRVILTTYPIPGDFGTSDLGTAPLPEDYTPPPSTSAPRAIDIYEEQGIKGRALASHLAGEEFKTSRQVIEEKRSEKQRKKAAGRGKVKDETPAEDDVQVAEGGEYVEGKDTDLYRYIEGDDGDDDPVRISDLGALMSKWGSRLRVRCTDDEIWMRLTGSPHRVSLQNDRFPELTLSR